jgi:hypothetical protein
MRGLSVTPRLKGKTGEPTDIRVDQRGVDAGHATTSFHFKSEHGMNATRPPGTENETNPKPGEHDSAGIDGEVGGQGRSSGEGSGGDGGDDSQRSGGNESREKKDTEGRKLPKPD